MAGEPLQVVYRDRSGASHTVDGLPSAWEEAGVVRDALSIKEALDAGEDLRRLELHDGSGLPRPALIAEAQCSLVVASLPFAGVVQQLQRCVDKAGQEAVTHGEGNGRAFTLLHAAAACQHKEAALLLLAAAPAMARRRDRRGRTVLHAVAELGWADVVAPLMMAAPEAATARDCFGTMPLVVAHKQRQAAAARALMSPTLSSPSASALLGSMMLKSIEQQDERELAALLWIAAESGADSGGGSSLLEGVLSDMGPSLLRAALDSLDLRATRVLLEAAPWLATQRDSEGQAALHWLVEVWRIKFGCLKDVSELAEVLLAVPGTATAQDSQGRTPLFLAAGAVAESAENFEDIPNLLDILAAAAPATVSLPAATGETPVHLAVRAGGAALQALLDAAPAQVAATVTAATGVQTPLQLAVGEPWWDGVTELLDAVMQASHSNGQDGAAAAWQLLLGAVHGPAELAEPDDNDDTLHHAAARRPSSAIMQLLLSEQVGDVMAVDRYGSLPLHAAAMEGCAETVRLLLAAAPAAASVGDAQGALPLHWAAEWGSAEAVRLLLEANPQAATTADLSGLLPLHKAASGGNSAAVQLLLEAAPATVGTASRSGDTALALALRNWKPDAAAVLLRHVSAQEGLEALRARAQPGQHHLYAVLVAARLPLSAAIWALVPSPCPALGRALPPALQHSTEQARQLVRRLPAADAERLQAGALALARAQRRLGVDLPGPLVGRILSLVLP